MTETSRPEEPPDNNTHKRTLDPHHRPPAPLHELANTIPWATTDHLATVPDPVGPADDTYRTEPTGEHAARHLEKRYLALVAVAIVRTVGVVAVVHSDLPAGTIASIVALMLKLDFLLSFAVFAPAMLRTAANLTKGLT